MVSDTQQKCVEALANRYHGADAQVRPVPGLTGMLEVRTAGHTNLVTANGRIIFVDGPGVAVGEPFARGDLEPWRCCRRCAEEAEVVHHGTDDYAAFLRGSKPSPELAASINVDRIESGQTPVCEHCPGAEELRALAADRQMPDGS